MTQPQTLSALSRLSDAELHFRTVEISKKEQKTTLLVLHHLHEVEQRKLYAQKSYGSLWEYTVKALGYSESQASERIKAMQFMFRIQEAKEALEAGRLKITQAAMTERVLRAEEKENKTRISRKEVQELIAQVEGKSKRETEKVLLSIQPQDPLKIPEKIRSITESISELRFPISEETLKEIERFWELKGRCSVSELFSMCLQFYLKQKDPQRREEKKNSEPKIKPIQSTQSTAHGNNKESSLFPEKVKQRSRYIPVSVKQEVIKRSGGQCEHRDNQTNRRCESRFLLQYDHITPYAFGGDSDSTNIRHLCFMHNQYLAKKMFAREVMEPYGDSKGYLLNGV